MKREHKGTDHSVMRLHRAQKAYEDAEKKERSERFRRTVMKPLVTK